MQGYENPIPCRGGTITPVSTTTQTRLRDAQSLADGIREHCAPIPLFVLDLIVPVVLTNAQLLDEMGADIGYEPLPAALAMLRDMGYPVEEPMPPFVDKAAPWRC